MGVDDEGRVLMNGICALLRESPESFLLRTQGREAAHEPGTGLARHLICWSLEPGLPASRTLRNKHVFISQPVCGIL